MISGTRPQQLKRTIDPYTGQLIILSLVTLGAVFVAITKKTWGLLVAVLIGWLLFGFLVCLGLRYRISWDSDEVCQQASGGRDVHIKYDDVVRVVSETSKPGEWLAASRPLRRIVIYAKGLGGEDRFIDVSLKHFQADDIRSLMRAIRARRPDLSIPTKWT